MVNINPIKKYVFLFAIVLVVAWQPMVIAQIDGERSSITDDGPAAWFTFSPSSPKPGELVTFDASPSIGEGGIISFQWNTTGRDGHDRAGSLIRTSFASAGEYPVTLTVHDALGRVSRVTRVIRVGIEHGVQLSIETNPAQLTVYIDDERKGQTPIQLTLAPGEYELSIQHYWRGRWETTLDLRDVRSLSLELDLWDDM